ncbi:MAG: flagellar hook-basal body complex protein [Roseomonas sp.]|nr:flagellar hook-basal body complex protein [Roseomonas sp.]MCA3393197.1 flagellar hook-basal body complex protein [Roseomonas sp.]MCA3406954.1 flagellar hook-basal body complex protein [Roseomonas sp.]
MSLYSSMNTALSGMNAQSRALGHISDNVANSQTVGFKRTDTNFVSFISESNSDVHRPGTVLARPDFTNQVQGTIEQVENPLAMAISGQGFFTAALPIGKNDNNTTRFDARQFYTRAGDFNRNSEGYMLNGAGYALQGWPVTDGVVDKTQLVPIRIQEDVFTPTPTAALTFTGNLSAGATTAQSTSIQVIDTLGRSRAVTLTFTPSAAVGDNQWTLSINAPDATTPGLGTIDVVFGKDVPTTVPATNPWAAGATYAAGTRITNGGNIYVATTAGVAAAAGAGPTGTGNAIADGTVTWSFLRDFDSNPDGTLAELRAGTGTLTGSAPTNNGPAVVTFQADFGQGVQTMTLNIGNFGVSGGLTQFASTGSSGLSVNSFEQDGIPLGAFSSVTTQKNGDVRINYDNGKSKVVARVPVTVFKDPDRLQHLDGQAFLRTIDSGEARVVEAGEDGAGLLTTSAIERSNVDIATEFSKLILAQRAYSANTRIVSTVDDLLQETLNMRR